MIGPGDLSTEMHPGMGWEKVGSMDNRVPVLYNSLQEGPVNARLPMRTTSASNQHLWAQMGGSGQQA